jgi:hypothetical protein
LLVKLLKENRDIFAWKSTNIPGVPRELIEHKLHVDPYAMPIKQHLFYFARDETYVIKKEIARLQDINFIREVYHLDWLANLVLVVTEPPKK